MCWVLTTSTKSEPFYWQSPWTAHKASLLWIEPTAAAAVAAASSLLIDKSSSHFNIRWEHVRARHLVGRPAGRPTRHTWTLWSASTIRFAANCLKNCYEIRRLVSWDEFAGWSVSEWVDRGRHCVVVDCTFNACTMIKPLFNAATASLTAALACLPVSATA